VATFKENGIDSIAVCFLHSHVNKTHEDQARKIIEEEHPDANVYLSSSVLPQIREYERFSTTIVNSYVSPPFSEYLENLSNTLRENGFSGNTSIAQSAGGRMHTNYSKDMGVNALFSGPSAGLEAAKLVGNASGYENLIAADMGGTSYDVSLITDGEISSTSEKWVKRNHVATPQVDINSIGAGGGSVAWIDEGGALRVGPESAGAEPGPACYGRGGSEPTVTDADVVLGYINPDNILGGDMTIYPTKAKEAIRKVADPLDMDVVEAAHGIYRLVNSNMTNAIREISVERGHDPRDYVLVGYGGASGIHAPKQCDDLGVDTCLIPKDASTLSALGCHNTDFKVTKVRSHITSMADYDLDKINEIFDSMREESENDMGSDMLERFEELEFQRSFDMQYPGQVHEVTVPIRARTKSLHEPDIESAIQNFHEKHEEIYAFKRSEVPPNLISLRSSLIGITEPFKLRSETLQEEDPSHAIKGSREAYFEEEGGFIEIDIYDGERLEPGNLVVGPGIVEEQRTTIVVQPGQMCMVDANSTYDIKI
jgi:N-methylhydantoinase A